MSGCPCDIFEFPPKPDIPPGLTHLPRQYAGFPEFRRALLSSVPHFQPLRDWRAREGDDFGLMLLEMWAYVLDILAFYDARIAHESYLRPAVRKPSARKLTGLIGYQPRPAFSAFATLALTADGPEAITAPERTGFRSEPFDDEPPQVFELLSDEKIYPLRNSWTLAPVRRKGFDDVIRLAADAQGVVEGQVVLLRQEKAGKDELWAGQVSKVEVEDALDGETYFKVLLAPKPNVPAGTPLNKLDLSALALSAAPNPFFPGFADIGDGHVEFNLDGLYPQLQANQLAVVEIASDPPAFHPVRIINTGLAYVTISAPPDTDGNGAPSEEIASPTETSMVAPTVPVTRIEVEGDISLPKEGTLHFRTIDGGDLTRTALTLIDAADLSPQMALTSPVEPLRATPSPADFFLKGEDPEGAAVSGSIDITLEGSGVFKPDLPATGVQSPLRTPLQLFGNLVEAVRGESVIDEVLGSGDGSLAFQSFELKNAPLSYVPDPDGIDGRRACLEVRVNGVLWSQVASFFDAGPDDEVYTVQQNDENVSVITFGDGHAGAVLPSGVFNITATYKFGAGAAKPPPGAITQFARPVPGLNTVINPVACRGGADGETAADIKRAAPASVLTFGRAVSLADYEALALRFPGVVNAAAGWAWDSAFQRALVKVWIISDGASVAADLRPQLRRQGAHDTPLSVAEASPIDKALSVELEIDPRYAAETVVAHVKAALSDPHFGLLALANVKIGRAIFASEIAAQILSVAGTLSIRSMTLDGSQVPVALSAGEGKYFDFSELSVV